MVRSSERLSVRLRLPGDLLAQFDPAGLPPTAQAIAALRRRLVARAYLPALLGAILLAVGIEQAYAFITTPYPMGNPAIWQDYLVLLGLVSLGGTLLFFSRSAVLALVGTAALLASLLLWYPFYPPAAGGGYAAWVEAFVTLLRSNPAPVLAPLLIWAVVWVPARMGHVLLGAGAAQVALDLLSPLSPEQADALPAPGDPTLANYWALLRSTDRAPVRLEAAWLHIVGTGPAPAKA